MNRPQPQPTAWSLVRAGAALLALAFGALITVLVVLAAPARADLPAGREVDQQEVCFQCHDLSDALEARVTHPPAEMAECAACHNPHVSRFEALLQERPGPLCFECHGDVAEEIERPAVHPPAAGGECAACHEPHGSAHSGLLRAAGVELCATCHLEVATWSERAVQHVPFAQGDCAQCHEPHGSATAGLTRGFGAQLCGDCHSMDGAFRTAHSGYPVENAPCQQCHDPHASARPGLFRESLHPPFEAGDCGTCHAGPGSADPFATTLPAAELCAACHDAAVEENLHAAFPHAAAGGGDCTACHNPHTGSGEGLLLADQQELCLSCHDPGGGKSELQGRFSTHAGQFDCTTCHQPHGGERPLLLAEDSVTLCGGCHAHEHGATHPLGEETRDPRNGQPMSCRSCHGIHDAPYEHYLHRSSDRELCLTCHKEIGGGGS